MKRFLFPMVSWQLAFFSDGGAVTIWDATPEEGK
jgi:hypothetical protein